MTKPKQSIFRLLRLAPVILCLGLAGAYLLSGRELSVQALLSLAPHTPVLAAIFLIGLYALKSVTVVFPILVLNVLGGYLFSPVWAMAVNGLGTAVDLALPYWIGRLSGTGLVRQLEVKYPKIGSLLEPAAQNPLFLSFFLRAISCLPGDIVSMCFGAISMPFGKYMLGSFLGMLPCTVPATLLGMSITDPSSPLFWVSISLTAGVALLSLAGYLLWRRRTAAEKHGAP